MVFNGPDRTRGSNREGQQARKVNEWHTFRVAREVLPCPAAIRRNDFPRWRKGTPPVQRL